MNRHLKYILKLMQQMFLCASCAPQRTVDLRQGKKLSQLILEERYQNFANKTTLRIADSNHKGEDYEDSSYFTGDSTFHGWIATCQVPSLFSRKLRGSSDIFAAGSLRWACQARTSTQLWLAFPTVVDAWYLWPSILLWIHWSMEGIWIKVAMILTGISCKSSLTMVMLVNLQDIGMPKQRTRSCALVVVLKCFENWQFLRVWIWKVVETGFGNILDMVSNRPPIGGTSGLGTNLTS